MKRRIARLLEAAAQPAREATVALLFGVAGALITVGTTLVYRPAGLIVGGFAVALWTVVVFSEVGP